MGAMYDTGMNANSDFSSGSINRHILRLSIPLMAAQFVQLLYNIVDRIYIGHMADVGTLAITGLGLTFPITTLLAAFTNLFGTGAVPLFSIARGKKEEKEAGLILNNTFVCLILCSIIVSAVCLIWIKPILYAFGASDRTWPYARDYLQITLPATPFLMAATGMNSLISAQGRPALAMMTTVLGAAINIVLDPIFIFSWHLGIQGAAWATVLGQLAAFLWVMILLTGTSLQYRLSLPQMKLSPSRVWNIMKLGTAGFVMQASNFAVQITCNAQLSILGGDLYVGVMTLLTSVRDLTTLPMQAMSNGAQPVMGYNFGARKPRRIWQSIRFVTIFGLTYSLAVWAIVWLFPAPILSLFSEDANLIETSISALHIYFFSFFMMALQFAGQSVFTGLGQAGYAVFFSIFRKIILVVPLTILLPKWLGLAGIFTAEPVSNILGGLACYSTMIWKLKHLLGKESHETA